MIIIEAEHIFANRAQVGARKIDGKKRMDVEIPIYSETLTVASQTDLA
jgi:hypothetical protein